MATSNFKAHLHKIDLIKEHLNQFLRQKSTRIRKELETIESSI